MKRHSLRCPSALATVALFLLMGVLTSCAFIAREATIVFLTVNAQFSSKEIEFELNKSFIEKYKDRVSITAIVTVDKAMLNPVARNFDGDFHFAGRSPEIALPLVVEIANGAKEKKAMDLVHSVEGAGKPLKITGVWRIWPEHTGSTREEQGDPLLAMDSYNPDHIFEIHPATRINDIGMLDSLRPVERFLPGDAHGCFAIYEQAECKITVGSKTVTMVVEKGLRNDVEFIMEIVDGRQIEAYGGRFVIASAMDFKGNVLVKRLRLVFAKDSPPEKAVRLLKRGDRLHVFGLPRVDFAEISQRVRNARTNPALLVKPMPYEIIILGVYKDEK